MTLLGKLILVGVCCVVSNFLYQWSIAHGAAPNWDQAIERSFFQAVALGIVAALGAHS